MSVWCTQFLRFEKEKLIILIIQRSARIRRDIGCDSGNREPRRISWNRKFRKNLYGFIPKSMGFSQSKLRISASTDILRIPEKCRKCRYANIAQLFCGSKNLDKLEKSKMVVILKNTFSPA